MISLSSSATSSSSSSSLCASAVLTNNPAGRSSVSVLRPSYMLQSLSEYMSPSLSKAFFSSSSSTTNDEKTATLTPLNHNPVQANPSRHASFTGKILMRQTWTKRKLMISMTFEEIGLSPPAHIERVERRINVCVYIFGNRIRSCERK